MRSDRSVRRPRRPAARAVVAVAVALMGIGAPPATAKGKAHVIPCTRHKHEVARVHGSVLWTQRGALLGCGAGFSSGEPNRPEEDWYPNYQPTGTHRLGPWSAGSKVRFDGVEVTWAYRKRLKTGEVVDRLYAGDARNGLRWLSGAQASSGPADGKVAGLKLGLEIVAWVTTKGTVVAAAHEGFGDPAKPDPFDFELVGPGTVGAPGLVDALAPQDNRLLIGTFTAAAPQAQATLQLDQLPDQPQMNTQGCRGSHRWQITVETVTGEPRVGAIWRAAFDPRVEDCG